MPYRDSPESRIAALEKENEELKAKLRKEILLHRVYNVQAEAVMKNHEFCDGEKQPAVRISLDSSMSKWAVYALNNCNFAISEDNLRKIYPGMKLEIRLVALLDDNK